MTLRYAEQTDDVVKSIESGIKRAASRRPEIQPASTATPSHAHPIYDLQTREVAAGATIEAVALTGIRYLLIGAGGAVAAAEFRTASDGMQNELTTLNFGPFGEATLNTLRMLEEHPAIVGRTFAVSLLRCSAIYLMSIWLSADNPDHDIFVPLAPAPPGLEDGRLYELSEFFDAVRPLTVRAVQPKPQGVLP
jgi:hypothetical protein